MVGHVTVRVACVSQQHGDLQDAMDRAVAVMRLVSSAPGLLTSSIMAE